MEAVVSSEPELEQAEALGEAKFPPAESPGPEPSRVSPSEEALQA